MKTIETLVILPSGILINLDKIAFARPAAGGTLEIGFSAAATTSDGTAQAMTLEIRGKDVEKFLSAVFKMADLNTNDLRIALGLDRPN